MRSGQDNARAAPIRLTAVASRVHVSLSISRCSSTSLAIIATTSVSWSSAESASLAESRGRLLSSTRRIHWFGKRSLNSIPMQWQMSSGRQSAKQCSSHMPSSVLVTLKLGRLSSCAGHFASQRLRPVCFAPSSMAGKSITLAISLEEKRSKQSERPQSSEVLGLLVCAREKSSDQIRAFLLSLCRVPSIHRLQPALPAAGISESSSQ